MDAQATAQIPCILQSFKDMPDPRDTNRRHLLSDIFAIALFAVFCGADGWVGVVRYAKSKLKWLQTFLQLPHGIPSHDTFGKVFSRLDPDAFERCFQSWMTKLTELSGGKLVAIDGKSLRQSFAHAWEKNAMAHMVSAFVEANRMCFAQVKTDGKGQELSAIEQLLDMLDLNAAVVSIDALGCQKSVAAKTLARGGHYLLRVKDNQPKLLEKLKVTMDDAILDGFAGTRSDSFEETDGGHGRIETRKLWVCWDVKLLGELAREWPDLRAMIAIDRTREVNGHKSVERHYYISSLDARTRAPRLASYVRGHWSVENNLHWQLDVSFNEDRRRLRKGHAAENFSRLCRLALNQLKKEQSAKVGIAIKRQMCGWENDYLLTVLAA
jgi:predicted transposase YbfD/YdcC